MKHTPAGGWCGVCGDNWPCSHERRAAEIPAVRMRVARNTCDGLWYAICPTHGIRCVGTNMPGVADNGRLHMRLKHTPDAVR